LKDHIPIVFDLKIETCVRDAQKRPRRSIGRHSASAKIKIPISQEALSNHRRERTPAAGQRPRDEERHRENDMGSVNRERNLGFKDTMENGVSKLKA
jgi:hypothetical protein